MERVMGIEPTPSAWKAEVLPLNYTRLVQPPRARKSLCINLRYRPSGTTRPGRFPHGGGGRIRTFEGVSRQIYSLLPLTAWVPHREKRAAYSDFAARACQRVLARELLAADFAAGTDHGSAGVEAAPVAELFGAADVPGRE